MFIDKVDMDLLRIARRLKKKFHLSVRFYDPFFLTPDEQIDCEDKFKVAIMLDLSAIDV